MLGACDGYTGLTLADGCDDVDGLALGLTDGSEVGYCSVSSGSGLCSGVTSGSALSSGVFSGSSVASTVGSGVYNGGDDISNEGFGIGVCSQGASISTVRGLVSSVGATGSAVV